MQNKLCLIYSHVPQGNTVPWIPDTHFRGKAVVLATRYIICGWLAELNTPTSENLVSAQIHPLNWASLEKLINRRCTLFSRLNLSVERQQTEPAADHLLFQPLRALCTLTSISSVFYPLVWNEANHFSFKLPILLFMARRFSVFIVYRDVPILPSYTYINVVKTCLDAGHFKIVNSI